MTTTTLTPYEAGLAYGKALRRVQMSIEKFGRDSKQAAAARRQLANAKAANAAAIANAYANGEA